MAKLSVTVKRFLLLAAFLFILWQIWSRVVIFVRADLTELVVLIAVIAVIFLLIDHLINHEAKG